MKNETKQDFNLRSTLILTSLSFGMISFFLPIYSREMNMSSLKIAGLFSLLALVIIISRPIIGKLIDKVGRKPVLMAGIIVYFLSYLIFSIADTALLLYIARFIQGVASALVGISIYAIVADTHTSENISEGFGKVSAAKATGNMYGCILAYLVVAFVPFVKGWKILFTIFAVACLIAVFKVKTSFKESKNANINKKITIKNYSRSAIIVLIFAFITALFSAMVAPILMIYLQDKYEANLIWLAIAFYPAMIIDSSLSRRIGRMVDKLGKCKSMIIGISISAITIIIIPSCTSIIIFAIIWTLQCIGESIYGFAENGLYTKLNSKNDKGEIFGIYTFVCDLGAVIGPLVGGFLYETVASSAPFYLNGIAMIIVAILITLLLKNEIKPKQINEV